jgi:hypothetical protein
MFGWPKESEAERPSKWSVPSKYLGIALQDGYDGGNCSLKHQPIGSLLLPTGKLVACDPLVFFDSKPFELLFPKGEFPVVLSIAQFRRENVDCDQRVAFATIRFCSKPTVAWDMLVLDDQDTTTLGANEIFGYGVDSGTGCFMDERAATSLLKRFKDDISVSDKIGAEMEKTYVHTRSWLNLELDLGLNLVAFSSGVGDGVYASYVGFADDGDITVVVTDFYLIERSGYNPPNVTK